MLTECKPFQKEVPCVKLLLEFVFLRHSRLSLSTLHLQVVQTLEDHHQEVLSLYRDFGFAGLIAQDSEFALCNVPAYFSSHALKLSWNGKNLTTHQYLLSEAARQLGLKTQHLPCFAALLGNEKHALTNLSLHIQIHKIKHVSHISLFEKHTPICELLFWHPSLSVCRSCSLAQQAFERVSVLQEIIFCLMRTWLPSTGVCWDQNTH